MKSLIFCTIIILLSKLALTQVTFSNPLYSKVVETDFGGIEQPVSVLELSNGKLIVVGSGRKGSDQELVFLALNADGSPAVEFGDKGKVVQAAKKFYPTCAVLTQDEKIIVGGYYNGETYDFCLKAFNAKGEEDQHFGNAGTTLVDLVPMLEASTKVNFGNDQIFALAIRPEGQIVAVGSGNVGDKKIGIVAQFTPNGQLDPSFGSKGVVINTLFLGSVFQKCILLPDAKILVGGTNTDASKNNSFNVARLHADGSLDLSFNKYGQSIIRHEASSDFGQFKLQADGKILVAGSAYNGKRTIPLFARLNADGTKDVSFGVKKQKETCFNVVDINKKEWYEIQDFCIKSDGSIQVLAVNRIHNIALFQVTAQFGLDQSFGTEGLVLQDIDSMGSAIHAMLTSLKNGKMLVSCSNKFNLLALFF